VPNQIRDFYLGIGIGIGGIKIVASAGTTIDKK